MRCPIGTKAVLLCLAVATSAAAQDSRSELQSALNDLHAWVGEGEKGQGWRQHLRSADVAAQMERGAAADRAILEGVHQLYSADTPGLERPQFVSVRTALAKWLQELPTDADLGARASAASEQFAPLSDDDLATKKAALSAAADALAALLSSSTPDNAKQWNQYLRLDALQQQLAADAPDPRQLVAVFSRFRAKHVGLELPEFTAVRQALRDYLSAMSFQRQSNPDQFAARVNELARRLGDSAETENTHAIGRILGWLDSGSQVPELVRDVRARYHHPNMHARFSERLLHAGVEAPVDELQDVNEVILGTSIYGTARLQAQLALEFVPSAEQAAFDIQMQGVASGNNVGYNGPVTICSYGVTQVYSAKRVYLGPNGLSWDYAYANCSTHSNINGIGARSKIVQNIAWKRAGKMKSQTEAIAASRAETRVARSFDGQAAELLEEANQQYRDKVRYPLVRQDAFPQKIRFMTDDDNLHLEVVQANPYQLAAPADPPTLEPESDLGLQLHESVIGNFTESLLGGQTLTDERLVELLTDAGAEVPDELAITPDKDPWSISFSSDRPVLARFQDNRVRLAIRGTRFTRGDQEIRSPIEISATYTLAATGSGSRLDRQGDIEVNYLNQERLSLSQVAMKTFLSRKFSALFKEEIVSDGLALPGKWEQVGQLRLQQLDAANSWLTLSWSMLSTADQTASTDSASTASGG